MRPYHSVYGLFPCERWIKSLSGHYCFHINTKKGAKNNEINANVKRPLREKRKVFGAITKIIGEGQLVDPLIHYLTSVIAS